MCFVALGIEHGIRLRNTVICVLSVSAIFLHLFLKVAARFSGKKMFTEIKKKAYFGFCTIFLFVTFLTLRKTGRDAIINININKFSCKSPLNLVRV